jgi:hypothetical protein
MVADRLVRHVVLYTWDATEFLGRPEHGHRRRAVQGAPAIELVDGLGGVPQ